MTARQPVPFRGGGFSPRPVRYLGTIVFFALIAGVEIGTRQGWISNVTLPRPSSVALVLYEMGRSGELWKHLVPSLERLAVGGGLGILAGVATGVMMGLFSHVRAGVLPLVSALFPVPKIALLPLFVIWFGIDELSKVMLIAVGTFTPTVVATFGAVDTVDRTLIRMGQSFGLGWKSIVWKIVLPGALPGILSGLRVSIAIAIILLVSAEMLGAEFGIGAFVLSAGALYDLEKLFAGVTVLSLLGLFVAAIIGRLESWLLDWR